MRAGASLRYLFILSRSAVKKREAERRREKNEAKSSGFCILNGIYMYNIFKDDDDDDDEDESLVSLMIKRPSSFQFSGTGRTR